MVEMSHERTKMKNHFYTKEPFIVLENFLLLPNLVRPPTKGEDRLL